MKGSETYDQNSHHCTMVKKNRKREKACRSLKRMRPVSNFHKNEWGVIFECGIQFSYIVYLYPAFFFCFPVKGSSAAYRPSLTHISANFRAKFWAIQRGDAHHVA